MGEIRTMIKIDNKFIELMKIAGQIVMMEDRKLLKELAKI